jgi:hypothetical protein
MDDRARLGLCSSRTFGRPILNGVKKLVLPALVAIALIAAGCGGSGGVSTTQPPVASPHKPGFMTRIYKLGKEYGDDPRIVAYKYLLAPLAKGEEVKLGEARAVVRPFLRASDAYLARLRELRVPACALSFKRRTVRFESRVQNVEAKTIPLLEKGGSAAVAAYGRQTRPAMDAEQKRLGEAAAAFIHGGPGDPC